MSEPPSKSAVKNAKTDASKAAKKRPDPQGLALIEQADAAMGMKELSRALELYQQAKAVCEASSTMAAPKEKRSKEKKPDAAAGAASGDATDAIDGVRQPRLVLSAPADNVQAKPLREGVDAAHNYAAQEPARLKEHLAATGGKYRTRFPPEPNGYLHIGHAKAMNFNFGQARLAREAGLGGETVMRFDDTNPTAEEQEFIDSILDNVAWLGHEPVKVTYSSDYFQDLYDLAVRLIDAGSAYVCHQSADEVKASRALLRAYHTSKRTSAGAVPPLPAGAASPHRERSVEENRRLFLRMKQGRYAEGEAFLRMKGDLHSDNPALWDPAAYRIMYHAHPRTADAWCVYPTYDYTHCIVDSLEDITHSLCTLEFETRQAVDGPYYWLLDRLRLYKPVTWEYSRLNLTHSLMSKRKLKYLVNHGHVSGWDDPRLVTLDGLRRRGFSAGAINRFCEAVGVTRAKMTARWQLLEQIARHELDAAAPRRFAVLRPLEVRLTGVPPEGKDFSMANHPKDASLGSRTLRLTDRIYIERDDFREVDDPKFFGLAPGKEVGLLGAGANITCTEVVHEGGELVALVASVDLAKANKPKGHLHWVAAQTAVPAEVRVYDVLFLAENPEEAAAASAAGADEGEGEEADDVPAPSGGAPEWVRLLNPNSCTTCRALVEPALRAEATAPAKGDRPAFQFQRQGYFCVDLESTRAAPVFNRVVALKEDKEKKTLG